MQNVKVCGGKTVMVALCMCKLVYFWLDGAQNKVTLDCARFVCYRGLVMLFRSRRCGLMQLLQK